MLSKKVKYAIKALIVLARAHGQERGTLQVAEIAEQSNAPKKFLEQILQELKNAGILKSRKGQNGGYYLLRKPEELTLTQIIRLIDGPIAPISCVSLNYYERCEDCPEEEVCGLRHVMIKVRDTNLQVYNNTTVSDLI